MGVVEIINSFGSGIGSRGGFIASQKAVSFINVIY